MATTPILAGWILKLFCSGAEYESVTGDLMEQYLHGRGRLWYWRQVLNLAWRALYTKLLRRPLLRKPRLNVGEGLLLLLFAALCSEFLSLATEFLVMILAVILGGAFVYLWLHEEDEPHEGVQSEHSILQPYHPGISMHHISVEGAVGFLFVLATGLIFGIGVPAIREILIATVPLGIFGGAILLHWHKRHPVKLQGLGLRPRK